MARRNPFPDLKVSLVALAVLGVAMVLVVLLLPGGSSTPSLDEVAALAARPAHGPAPPGGAEAGLGWRATGSRTDRIGDRVAVTVHYARGPDRATVTVVDGGALSGAAPAGSVVRRAGDRTRVATGAGTSRAELGDLAAAVGGGAGS
ncbi:MAG TPA: hypothetical protein VFG74_03290 [Miltoncostaeaceae bacterium]|nr:hypothetical protein [Miltoncostaeaceae bacterium]